MNKLLLTCAGALAAGSVVLFLFAPPPAPVTSLKPEPAMAAPIPAAPLLSVPPIAPPASEPTLPPAAAPLRKSPPLATAPRLPIPRARLESPPPADSAPLALPPRRAALPASNHDVQPVAPFPPVPRTRANVPGNLPPAVVPPPLPTVVELEVPAGGRLPLALVESGAALSDAQLAAVDATATDFVRAVASGASGNAGTPENSPTLWSRARHHADERYRLLFGNQAADLAASRAAAEAATQH